MRKLNVIFSLLLVFTACKKAADRPCFKSVGESTTLEVSVGSFDRMLLKEHLKYVLVQDTVEKVVITGGKNLVNFISVDVTDGLLTVLNENRCNFLRSYEKKVTVEIHFKSLINLEYIGTEDLTNKDTLSLGWFTMLIRDGAGPVKLNFNADAVFATVSHGWGDFTFNGVVNHANLNVRSNGFCDTYGLKVLDSLTVVSNTQGSVKVNANNTILRAETDADGSIYYKGTPISISYHQYGKGELIDAN
jgi:hypothetical protein